MRSIGDAETHLDDEAIRGFVADALAGAEFDGASVCVVVPDGTRRCPLPLLLDAIAAALDGRVRHLEVLVALGTHAAMGGERLARWVGAGSGGALDRFGVLEVTEHAWWDEDTFVQLGHIPAAQLASISQGRLSVDVPVRLNRAVLEADRCVIVGPVLPHEVVGFSGGNKYLFPGLSGPEMIDVSHWLGALIGSAAIIGTSGITPVRALIDEAAALVPTPVDALCVVTDERGGLHAASFGDARSAWAAAVDVSAATHIRRLDAPVERVISIIPDRYDDLWTAAKGFYKVEPVVADAGTVILYAPRLTEITPMHPGVEEIGYHVADYFTGQWERFADRHWGELAHSSHLRGAGRWDPVRGEQPRVSVVLATGIDRARTEAVGLGWMDPADVDLDAARVDPDVLVVPDAGEVLYRLRS